MSATEALAERDTQEERHPFGLAQEALAPRVVLTDRDRDILGLLVLGRYLTTAQLYRLFFDGKRVALPHRRLDKLANPGGQPPYVAQRFFLTETSRVCVWSATPQGLLAALPRADEGQLRELPKHDVKAMFLAHLVQLNELLVELWRTPGKWARVRHPAFRWTPSDVLKLEYGAWEVQHHRQMPKHIIPDAMLELPRARRRWFLECEMGTNTIVPESPNKPGATLNKAAQYQRYLLDGPGPGATYYAAQYPDAFAAEVLYLVRDAKRAKSVNTALAAWRATLRGQAVAPMRALTFDDATKQLRQLAGLPQLPSSAESPASSAPVDTSAGLSARASTAWLSADEVKLVWRYLYDAHAAIHHARGEFRKLGRQDLPAYPKDHDALVALVERLRATNG